MAKHFFYMVIFFITFTSQAQMTMTTTKKDVAPVHIGIEEGSGYISIDWGDGSKIRKFTLKKRLFNFYHNYYDTVTFHTIKVTGRNIKIHDCSFNELISLDISKNRKLKGLRCTNNKLTSLDVNKNTKLEWIVISNNLLSSDSLNIFFESLPNNKREQWNDINIDDNSGTCSCNTDIANKKRWNMVDKSGGKWLNLILPPTK